MINIAEKCVGCTACYNICPRKCIEMKENTEGFLYPVCNDSICIKCGMCEKVCPIVNLPDFNNKDQKREGYIFQNSDCKVLAESTSGGFFSALAESIISENGVVFGAAYDENFYLHHIYIESNDKIGQFRNSKYVQSNPKESFLQCKQFLQNGRMVLYSGTPCQVAGLKCFLEKEYKNLITCDVICRGVPSPGLFRDYVEWMGGKSKISNILFRKKYKSYYSSFMTVHYITGKTIRRDKHGDPMLKLFFNDLCSRPSCYECMFKTVDRVSDFTMFDSWHGFRYANGFKSYGTTGIIAHTAKGTDFIAKLSRQHKCISANYLDLLREDGCMMTQSVERNVNRDKFFNDYYSKGKGIFTSKYCKNGIYKRIIIWIKMRLADIGALGPILKLKIK